MLRLGYRNTLSCSLSTPSKCVNSPPNRLGHPHAETFCHFYLVDSDASAFHIPWGNVLWDRKRLYEDISDGGCARIVERCGLRHSWRRTCTCGVFRSLRARKRGRWRQQGRASIRGDLYVQFCLNYRPLSQPPSYYSHRRSSSNDYKRRADESI